MSADDDRAGLIDILRFQLDAGVDVALDEVPADRFSAGADASGPTAPAVHGDAPVQMFDPVPPRRPAATPAAPATPAPPVPEVAVMAAREAARAAASLEALRAILERFEGCALRMTASRLVFADGNPGGRVMLVGEAPGAEEDRQGLPFVGRSGRLLDRMLAAIGLDRTQVYIANVVPWRPPGNRAPTPQESATCLPFLTRQIELADPDVLVCLGGPATAALLGVKDGILKTRGRWFGYHTGRRDIRAMPTLHPAYLLRTPLQKRLAWRDLLAIRAVLDGSA